MSILAVRRYAYAINEIFGMVPNADPDSISLPSQVLDELNKLKETLEEWEEADDCIDTPDELSILVSGLREEHDEAEDRIEELESELEQLKDKFEAIEQSTEASAYNELIIQDLREKVDELEECKDITMDDLTTAEKEGDETLEEYVKRRIDKYILEGSLFTSDEVEEARRHAEDWEDSYNELKQENEYAHTHLEFVRNTLTEPIQEAVPPS